MGSRHLKSFVKQQLEREEPLFYLIEMLTININKSAVNWQTENVRRGKRYIVWRFIEI